MKNTRISGGITTFFLPLTVGMGKRGFFSPAYVFLPYSLGMAPVLPVYENMILVCLLGKCISQSSCDLFSAAGQALVTAFDTEKLVSFSDMHINLIKFIMQPYQPRRRMSWTASSEMQCWPCFEQDLGLDDPLVWILAEVIVPFGGYKLVDKTYSKFSGLRIRCPWKVSFFSQSVTGELLKPFRTWHESENCNVLEMTWAGWPTVSFPTIISMTL